jgi:hypothetical protein
MVERNMTEIQKLPAFPEGRRAETGPMQFGDDWPGIFIRGDLAVAYAIALRSVTTHAKRDRQIDWLSLGILEDLAELMESCNTRKETK